LAETNELNSQQKKLHRNLLFNAITKNEKGDELLWYFWEKENRVKLINYDDLIQQDPIRAFKLTKSNLKSLEKYYIDNHGMSDNSVYMLAKSMLNFTLEHEREIGIEIIKYNLANPPDKFLGMFTRKIIELQDKQFIDVMLPMLEGDYQYFVQHAVVVLLSFNDDAVNDKVASSLKRNRSLRVSDNWTWLYEQFEVGGVLDGKPNNEGRLRVEFRH